MYNKIYYAPFNNDPMDNNVCYPTQFNQCASYVPYVVCCPCAATPQYPYMPQPQPAVNPYVQQMTQPPYAVKKNANINNPYPTNPDYCNAMPRFKPDGGYGTGKITIYGPNLIGLYIIYDNRCHMYGTTMTSEELRQYLYVYDHFEDIDMLLSNNSYRLSPDEKGAINNLTLSFDNVENMEEFETSNATIFDIFSKMSDVVETDHSISFAFNDKSLPYLRKYISDLDYFLSMDKKKEEENDD